MQEPIVATVLAAALLAGCLGPTGELLAADAAGPGLACDDPCKLLLDTSPWSGWEPHVAIHPDNPDHIVVASRNGEATGGPLSYTLWFDLHVTTDGGASWNVTPLRYTQPLGSGPDPTAPNVVGDPVLAFLPDGALLAIGATLQYLTLGPAGGVIAHARLFAARSPDGGFTVEEPVTVVESEGLLLQGAALPEPLPPLGGAVMMRLHDKPWIATGLDGTALLAWAALTALHPETPTYRGDIAFSVSRDGGASWSAPATVARGGSLQGPAPAIGADGAWYVAYQDFGAMEARLAVSKDEGATWSDHPVAASRWMPSLALAPASEAAPAGQRVFVALAQPVRAAPGEAYEPDSVLQVPVLTWSDDAGATWSEPQALDDPEAPGRVLPSVAVDGEGTVYATFAHAVGDGESASASFHAVALDPAATTRSDLVLDPRIAAPTRSLGDYLGLAAGTRGAFAVWTTTGDDGGLDIAGARLHATWPPDSALSSSRSQDQG